MANFAPQREKNIVSGGALEPPRVRPCPLNLPTFCTPGITPDRQRTYNNEGGRTRTEGVKASGRDHPPGCLRAPIIGTCRLPTEVSLGEKAGGMD